MRNFRGLTKEGKWVYGTAVSDEIFSAAPDPNWSWIFDGPKQRVGGLGWVEVLSKTVGQSIDAKDKNDKEMYFDDMVIWNKKKYVIVWNKTCLGTYLEHLDSYLARQKDPKLGKFIVNLMYGRAVYLEVIGTVHDKLLEETSNE